jgi:hypothetical protein
MIRYDEKNLSDYDETHRRKNSLDDEKESRPPHEGG